MTINKLFVYAVVEAILGVAGLAIVWITLGMWPAIGIFLCMFSVGMKLIFHIQQHIQEQHG